MVTYKDRLGQGFCKYTGCSQTARLSPTMIVFAAPHASQRMPNGEASTVFPDLLGSHYAVDIGTEELSKRLADEAKATAILGNVSRLCVDLNRPLKTAFAADRPLGYKFLGDGPNTKDYVELHSQFHSALEIEIQNFLIAGVTPLVVDVHSFSRAWQSEVRDVDIGVCDHRLDNIASCLYFALAQEFNNGFNIRMDEPYSGTHPGAYTSQVYKNFGANTVTIEVCNDLLDTSEKINRIVPRLWRGISRLLTEFPGDE